MQVESSYRLPLAVNYMRHHGLAAGVKKVLDTLNGAVREAVASLVGNSGAKR